MSSEMVCPYMYVHLLIVSFHPGTEPISVEQANSIPVHGYEEVKLTITSHVGTHIDLPSHMKVGAENISTAPVSKYYGPAIKVDVRHVSGLINIEDLKPFEETISKSDFLILQTGHDQYFGSDQYFEGFPVLSPDAASYIIKVNPDIKGVGMDCISPDPCDTTTFDIHHILFNHNMVIIENLKDLDAIPSNVFTFAGFPMHIENGDGSPIRAVAIV
ncbi:hypothetical protein GEMRC1_008889 [Eukaryota sp. GEM-RC1]